MKITKRNDNCLNNFSFSYDGVDYVIEINRYSNNCRFANFLLRDITHDESYDCDGRIEINGHLIVVVYNSDEIHDRFFYTSARNITVYVDEEVL